MGNPAININPAPPTSPQPAANGILAHVAGHLIAGAMQSLPKAGPDQEGQPVRHVVVDVPAHGRVRITLKLSTYRKGRSRLWHWTALRADAE